MMNFETGMFSQVFFIASFIYLLLLTSGERKEAYVQLLSLSQLDIKQVMKKLIIIVRNQTIRTYISGRFKQIGNKHSHSRYTALYRSPGIESIREDLL